MDRFLFTHLPALRCKESIFHLACAWILGLVSGTLFSFFTGNHLVSLMRAAVFSRVSIVGLLSALTLPVLFSAFAVYILQPWLLIPIAFFKAFLFSYLSFGLLAAFGSAGWLIHLLFMFGDILMLPLLWSYWLKSLSDTRSNTVYCTIPILIIGSIIGCAEYRFISPFLANLIS